MFGLMLIKKQDYARMVADKGSLMHENLILRRSLRTANTCIKAWQEEVRALRGSQQPEKKPDDARQLRLRFA